MTRDIPSPERPPSPSFSGRTGTSGAEDELAALRRRIGRIEQGFRPEDAPAIPLGVPDIDTHLPTGGLAPGALYEIAPAAPRDAGAATAFCAALAARFLQESDGTLLWCLNPAVTDAGEIYPPALARFGIAPERLVALCARDDATILQAMEDALASGAPAAIVGEARDVSLTASRRLQLAAARNGVTPILLRPPAGRWGSAERTPSAACMRWRIRSEPSRPRGWAAMLDEPGFPCWRAALYRSRGGAPGDWTMEWRDETGDLALAAPLRDRQAETALATA